MWFLEKVRASPGDAGPLSPLSLSSPPASDKVGPPGTAFTNILTPDRIPEFCIPPRLASPALAKSPGMGFLPHRCLTEPGLQCAASCHGSTPGLVLPHLIQVESVEEIPGVGEGGEEDGTNSDPQSQAALSLPHIPKAQTSYGFCMLLESPHTRRKESIFHNDTSGSNGLPLTGLTLPRSRASSCSGARELASSPPYAHPATGARSIFLARQAAVDSDTASSTESSPFSSPLLGRWSSRRPMGSLFKARSQEGLRCKTLTGRGSLGTMTRAHSLSAEEGSSTDSSPNSVRRSSESLLEASRTYSLSPLSIFPLDMPCGAGRERLGRESTVALGKTGLLRLSSEYCPENRRLRVRLISVEGLYGAASEPKAINCCVTFSLLPGKVQKQRSTVIKHSRNPIFNEDFFFLGIAEDDLYSLSVRMKAVNKGCSMKRDLVLGESTVTLVALLAL